MAASAQYTLPGVKNTFKFFATGRLLQAVLILKGGRYGVQDSLVHEKDDPLIEFWAYSEKLEDFQFVSSYYLSTFMGIKGAGLALDFRQPNYALPEDGVGIVQEWAKTALGGA